MVTSYQEEEHGGMKWRAAIFHTNYLVRLGMSFQLGIVGRDDANPATSRIIEMIETCRLKV